VLENRPENTESPESLPVQARAAVNLRRSERRSVKSSASRFIAWLQQLGRDLLHYFSTEDPVFAAALTPALVVAALVFVRSPMTNYIFDEQEALLANPYVNGKTMSWWQAFRRDFWGLPADRSIGSYRPIPNVIWRALWPLGQSPWVLHWVNIVIHAVVAALLASLAFSWTKQRRQAWLTGGAYLLFAVLTEAVTGVVGLADVLAAMFMVISMHALRTRLWWIGPGVFVAVLLGLFSKESGIVAVGLIPLTALITSKTLTEHKPRVFARTLLAAVAAVAALVLYTELRRRWFPFDTPSESEHQLSAHAPTITRWFHAFLRWFHQPRLPADPMNNPLVSAPFPYRVAGALRVYASGFLQVLWPTHLSGDYSFPSEPVPQRLVFPASVAGAALLVLVPVAGVITWVLACVGEYRARREHGFAAPALASTRTVALGLLWFPLAYFPLSNIPVVLPTVRAERFWIIPAIGLALLAGVALERGLNARTLQRQRMAAAIAVVWFAFQATQARLHACDYADDLVFWQAAARAVPLSAKAHLNYAVMLGTRNRLDERLKEGAIAQRLAPKWPMAHVYQGDTYCRMHRYDEAFPHYMKGFKLGPNEPNLIALGLQCLWDGKQIKPHEEELIQIANEADNRSWLNYLVTDIVNNGEKHNGVQPKYRPRGYNEGPKK
jgi:hypothetical protein